VAPFTANLAEEAQRDIVEDMTQRPDAGWRVGPGAAMRKRSRRPDLV